MSTTEAGIVANEKVAEKPRGASIGGLRATNDVNRIEAPVTLRAYLMCAFASFGGIFFGTCSNLIDLEVALGKAIGAVVAA